MSPKSHNSDVTKYFFLVLLIGINVYFLWNALNLFFPGMDTLGIIYASKSPTLTDFLSLFTNRFFDIPSFSRHYYRPIVSVTFAIDYLFWGLNPFGYQLTNVLLQISISVAIFFFLVIVWDFGQVPSFLSSLLFSIHPLMINNPFIPSRRQDMLVLLFFLLTFIFLDKYFSSDKKTYLTISVIMFLLALGSKENGIILLTLLYPVIAIKKFKPKKILKYLFPFVATTSIYLFVRRLAIGGWKGGRYGPSSTFSDHVPPVFSYVVGDIFPTLDYLTRTHQFTNHHLFHYLFLIIIFLICYSLVMGILKKDGEYRIPKVKLLGGISIFACLTVIYLLMPFYDSIIFKTLLRHIEIGESTKNIFGKQSYLINWFGDIFFLLLTTSYSIFFLFLNRYELETDWLFDKITQKDKLMFLQLVLWIILPQLLYVYTRNYTTRNAYLMVLPCIILILLVLKIFFEQYWFKDNSPSLPEIILISGLAILLLTNILISPIFDNFSSWHCISNVKKQFLTNISNQLKTTPTEKLNIITHTPQPKITFPYLDKKMRLFSHNHSLIAWISLSTKLTSFSIEKKKRVFLSGCKYAMDFSQSKRPKKLKVTIKDQ